MATNQQLRTGDKLPALTRSLSFERGTFNENDRTVEVTFSTETEEVERWFGIEILDHSPGSMRTNRINNGAPFLMDHNHSDQRGVVERGTARIENRQGRATLRFSKSERGEELLREVADGMRDNVSVGYRINELQLERTGDNDKPDVYRATDWEPFEVSSVAVPFDFDAGIDRSKQETFWGDRAHDLTNTVKIREIPNKNDMSKPNTPEAEAPEEVPETETPAPTEAPAPEETREAPEAPAGLTAEDVTRAAAAEADRRDEIRALAAAFDVEDKESKRAIADKDSVEAFKLRIFDTMKTANPPIQGARSEDEENRPDTGTRAHTQETWGHRGIEILGDRAKGVRQNKVSVIEDNRNFIDGNGPVYHRALTGAVNLAQVAALDAGIGADVIDETSQSAVETTVFPVDVITSASVELSVQTEAPTVGFRNANEGATRKSANFESRVFQTMTIEEQIAVDIQGVLQASNDPGRVMRSQAAAITKAVMKHIATQGWYAGTAQSGADAKSSPGIIAQSNSAATHVVDAGGNSAKSSVWFLELGVGKCDHIYGNDSTLSFGEWNEETVLDGNSKPFRALVNTISARTAARLANKDCGIRIKNIEEDTLKLTVEFMYSAMQLADTQGSQPNAIFMHPRSLYQLRDDMQGNNTSDTNVPPPTSWDGIPIYTTTNLSIAETV